MITEEKIKQIDKELQEMFEKGELQELLKQDLDLDTLRFLGRVKDIYIQKQQREIIARPDFKI